MDLTDRHVAALQSKTRQHGMYVFTEPVPQSSGRPQLRRFAMDQRTRPYQRRTVGDVPVGDSRPGHVEPGGHRHGQPEGDVAFAGQSVVVDPYVNAASEADDQEQLIIADIDLTQTAAARKQRPFLGLRRPEWYV